MYFHRFNYKWFYTTKRFIQGQNVFLSILICTLFWRCNIEKSCSEIKPKHYWYVYGTIDVLVATSHYFICWRFDHGTSFKCSIWLHKQNLLLVSHPCTRIFRISQVCTNYFHDFFGRTYSQTSLTLSHIIAA